jgi:pimeloyl-ACP methyl ester carboxylesterase
MEARRRTHVEETGRKLCAAAHTSTAEAAHCDVATVPLSAYVPNRLKKLEPVRNEMPLVVVLHGLLGNANNWRSMLTRADFLPGFYSVSVDLRNHGKSGWAPTNSWAEMSNDVLAFAAGFGVHDACLLGHSMGGKVVACRFLQ